MFVVYPRCMDYRMGTPYDQFLWSRVADTPGDPAPGASGYFSTPTTALDPRLFNGDVLRAEIRTEVLNLLYDHWRALYNVPESWSRVWIAGSALSYQWNADRGGLGDLDVLIGVDYPAFYAANPSFKGIPPADLSSIFNEAFRNELHPRTAEWNGFEVTFYVNPGATDIRTIRPYAAYDLTDDEWTVRPPDLPADWDPTTHMPRAWWDKVNAEEVKIRMLIDGYQQARRAITDAETSAAWVTGAAELRRAVDAAVRMFDEIHNGRRRAFSEGGEGFFDYYNFRWQAHKRNGLIKTLHEIKSASSTARRTEAEELYGGVPADPARARSVALRWASHR